MYKDIKLNSLHFSPSDLIAYVDSQFASWLDHYVIEYDDGRFQKADEDELALVLQTQGMDHEKAFIEALLAQGKKVVTIPDEYSTQERKEATLLAVRDGVDVLYQAHLAFNQFSGAADFLVRVDGDSKLGSYHYQVWDTKLSKQAKPYFIIQLCCYAEMLESIQGVLSEQIGVVLGDGTQVLYHTKKFYAYYQNLKNNFLDFHQQFESKQLPEPNASDNHRRWSNVADQWFIENDHLSLVANISKTQIKKLEKENITTLTGLADADLDTVPKISPEIFRRLKRQAQLQVESRGNKKPIYEVIEHDETDSHRGLAQLPPASKMDVYFDMEGYPLVAGGLEYLFGNTYIENGEIKFIDFWAHNREQEKLAFEEFIDWAYDRWRKDSTMHIYHYAPYEVTAMKKLMQVHATREHEVDNLLRHGVFIDLYNIVRSGLRIGEPRYSIKNVEHIYRGRREGSVADAATSVVYYEHWIQKHIAGEEGDTWETSNTLKDIRDYNIDDCDSTLECAEWLRGLQTQHDIKWIGHDKEIDDETHEQIVTPSTQLRDEMLVNAEVNSVQQLLAYLLEFYWREVKPAYWRRYERAEMNEQELADDIDCLAGLVRTSTSPVKEKRSFLHEYIFDTEQETKLHKGSKCLLAEDLAIKIDIFDMDAKSGLVNFKLGVGKSLPERLSLIPNDIVPTAILEIAVFNYVESWFRENDRRNAIDDFLHRRRPRIKGNEGGAILKIANESDRMAEIIRTVGQLDSSVLCIQGPPGAGKSYTASHIIFDLLKQGKRVGITSNSHSAINHLMLSVMKLMDAKNQYFHTIKVQGKTYKPLDHEQVNYLPSIKKDVGFPDACCLMGGVAWTFANDATQGALDYLFVDEAGQVSIANLISVAGSANNLVLMGDQMQLGQPIQGSHPGESGLSVLDYYLQDQATIPDDLGIFLGTTWRMHPKICRYISDLVYEGKLEPEAHNKNRVISVDDSNSKYINKSSGLVYAPVEHEGNQQASEEEVAVILEIVDELCGREHFNEKGESLGPLDLEDMLFVAPFNLQVRKLQQALGEEAKVGSVDKFQGQEAPVVIISLCASELEDSSRGLKFVLDKNRLNVAISRAQSLVVLVANPALSQSTVNTIEQMELVNLLCSFVEHSAKK